MNRITLLAFIVFITLEWASLAQKIEYGEVSKTELESTKDAKFPEANAVVLYRYVNSYLGNYVEVHERIKIFNQEGYDNATIFIPYSSVNKVKGATYNLVNGEVVKTELDKDLIFEDEIIKDIEFKKFTFPNVSPGSVLEYTYETDGGYLNNIYLQYFIPIKKEKVVITNRTDIGVEILQNPRAFLDLTRIEESKSTTFLVNDVPALESENYVYDVDIYRSFLKLSLTALGDQLRFGNWNSLVEIINEVDDFGQAVKSKSFYKNDIEPLVASESDNYKKAQIVYNFLKEKMEWDKKYTYMPNVGIRKSYSNAKGNLAEINILYISMLRSLGIEANPVLSSTKLNGIPLTASISSFNSVLADVKIGQNNYLVDVSNPNSTFLYPSIQFLNWEGLRIFPDKSYDWIPLNNTQNSSRKVIVTANIDEELIFKGNVKERHDGYLGIETTQKLKNLGQNNLEDLLSFKKEGLEINHIKANSISPEISDISFDFEIENGIDEIDNKLYFSPLLFFTLEENPFKKEERKFAIDFNYSFKNQIMITIIIPEGYSIESLPEATKLLVEDMGSFTYRVNGSGNTLQVMAVFEINNPLLPYDKYDEIRGFFRARMEKETEKVVLVKN